MARCTVLPEQSRPEPGSVEFEALVRRVAVGRFKRLRGYLAKIGPTDRNPVGLPRTNGPDSRDPRRLADLVDQFGDVAGFTAQLAVTGLQVDWVEIVGPELADHLQIADFDQTSGRLRLEASSTAWATQVRMLVPTILARIDAEIGAGLVSEIEVTGPKPPNWKHGRRSVPGRGPRDTYG